MGSLGGGGIPLIELGDPNSEAIFGLQVISVPTKIYLIGNLLGRRLKGCLVLF